MPTAPDPPPQRGLLSRVGTGVPMVALALLLAALSIFCITTISAARAFVGGESAWSKSQKGATLALLQYAQTRDPALWAQYQTLIEVPLGDRRAREALDAPVFDEQARRAAREGFITGANHPDDVDGMIRLYRWFRQVPFMTHAIAAWAEGDELIAELQLLAHALHQAVRKGDDAEQLARLRAPILALEARLTPVEDRFSATLGEASRSTALLLTAVVAVATAMLTAVAVSALRHAAHLEQRQARALRDSEDRRERTLKGSSDGFWEWDLKRGTAYFSPRFEGLLGYEPGTLDPQVGHVQSLLHPEDAPAARRALSEHLQHARPYDVTLRMQHRSGAWRWLRSRALLDRGAEGTELRLSGSISDITDQRNAEQALSRREAMFRSLWETTADAVLIIDTTHTIRFANPAAHQTFGHASGSLQGQPLALLQPHHTRAAHVHGCERYMRTGQQGLDWRASEVVALHASGREMPMEICFSELELDGQRHFVGFLRDISRRKQAERALQEANEQLERRVAQRTLALTQANDRLRELDRLKSEFLATMSHELRTPLNSILGFTAIMQRGMSGPLTDEQQRQLGFVQHSGQHLLALINDVLDLSRIESGRMEVQAQPFDFADVAADALAQMRPLAEGKGLELCADAANAVPMVGDRRKVYQVLLNLLGNAVKFTPQGRVQLVARAEAGWLRVTVSDTGVGIAADKLGLLFEAFRQLDGSPGRTHEGTGLGLHLCRKLLVLMGGEITACSELGVGSTFSFALPLALQPAPATAASAEVA